MNRKKLIAVAAATALIRIANAEECIITAFSGNGELTWQWGVPDTTCRVEWASTLAGPWRSDWSSLQQIVMTNRQATARVPMFYRVLASCDFAYGLVAHWPMNEGTGTTALDATANNNDGTLAGDVTWLPQPDGGFALAFGGANGTVTAPDSASLGFPPANTGLTLWAWFKADSLPSTMSYPIMAKWGGGMWEDDEWKTELLPDGRVECTINATTAGGSPQTDMVTPNPVTVAKWHHMAMTWDGAAGKATLYIDGSAVVATNNAVPTLADTTKEVTIGSGNFDDQGWRYLDGQIDEARIYSRCLSSQEVRCLWAQQASGFGLAACWPMNEGSGTTVADSTTNDNDGALSGGVSWSVAPHGGYALDFGGVDGRLTVPDSPSLALPQSDSALTLWAWFKADSLPGSMSYPIMAKWGGGMWSDDEWKVELLPDGRIEATINESPSGTDQTDLVSPAPVSTGQWHHVALVWDGATTTASVYIDGQAAVSTNQAVSALADTGQQLTIGSGNFDDQGWRHFDGQIDDVRVFHRAMSAAEILAAQTRAP